MLAYMCENCKKITLWGCVNEFEQHFCNEECYKKYCKKYNYEPHLDKLYRIKTIFSRSK